MTMNSQCDAGAKRAKWCLAQALCAEGPGFWPCPMREGGHCRERGRGSIVLFPGSSLTVRFSSSPPPPPPSNPTEDAQNLISRLATRRRLAVGEDWSQDVQLGEQSELRYSYHVLCDEHYYGEGCSDYCRPRDDPFGHYACDELGARVCLPGWRGEYCSEDLGHGCDLPVPETAPLGRYPPEFAELYTRHALGLLQGQGETEGWRDCTCPQGFYGKNCEISAMTCADGPCFNAGTCAEKPTGGYTCHCPLGYHGSNCEKKIDRCTNNPCLNSGLCLDLGRRVLCKCRPGFAGPRCERNIDDCACNPCVNGGTCLDGANSYTCSCTLGYGGKDCSMRVDACGSSPCLNSGTCYTHFSGHVCECSAGYMGSSCEFKVQSPAPASSQRLAADDPFPMALAVSFALGLVTLALVVCAALAVLRQMRQGRKAGKGTVRNDLDTVNNLKEREGFLVAPGRFKVPNKEPKFGAGISAVNRALQISVECSLKCRVTIPYLHCRSVWILIAVG
uniref:Delta-like protein n=1 Tax=Terrapene triunguis TaxID=2587831 RepID=A0A674IM79_9SAUR